MVPVQYLTRFWGSKVKFSRGRQFFNFALVYFRKYKSQRHKTFTSMFPVQFYTNLCIVTVSWWNICGAWCPGREQRHPHRQNRQTANWVNGPDWHRIVQRGTINMSMQKISHVFGLRTPGNPKNRQISHIGMHEVSQGQWPRMTFRRSLCNGKVTLGHVLT